MQYEDRLTIATPEGIELELALAGVGSRFAAATIDGLIQLVVFLGLSFTLGFLAELGGGGWALAAMAVLGFALLFGYDVAFETLNSGRTPGKQALGLRVVRLGGESVGFWTSAIRNIVRLVDLLPPVTYAIGIVSILVTSRNQRLGDLAAGTLVIRDRRGDKKARQSGALSQPPPYDAVASWDVTAVTGEEVAAVRAFLERRVQLDPAARYRLAWEMTQRLAPKVAGAPPGLHPEGFLELLVAAKATRS